MNLNYIKEYLEVRKDNITSVDIDNLLKEIEDYKSAVDPIFRTDKESLILFIKTGI